MPKKLIISFLVCGSARSLTHVRTCALAHARTPHSLQSGSHSFSVPLDRRFLEERHTLYRWQKLVQPVLAHEFSALLRRLLGDDVEVLYTIKPKP